MGIARLILAWMISVIFLPDYASLLHSKTAIAGSFSRKSEPGRATWSNKPQYSVIWSHGGGRKPWRNCAKSRKVAGSIPAGVKKIFHWHNPPGHTMVLGSTQTLKEMSTRNISWGIRLSNLPLSLADCLEVREFQASGIISAWPGLYRDHLIT
jgi:hypothetical protein